MGLIWFQIVDFVSKLINMFTLFLPPMAFGKSLGRVDYHCDRCPECPECQGPTALAGLHKVVPAMVGGEICWFSCWRETLKRCHLSSDLEHSCSSCSSLILTVRENVAWGPKRANYL